MNVNANQENNDAEPKALFRRHAAPAENADPAIFIDSNKESGHQERYDPPEHGPIKQENNEIGPPVGVAFPVKQTTSAHVPVLGGLAQLSDDVVSRLRMDTDWAEVT